MQNPTGGVDQTDETLRTLDNVISKLNKGKPDIVNKIKSLERDLDKKSIERQIDQKADMPGKPYNRMLCREIEKIDSLTSAQYTKIMACIVEVIKCQSIQSQPIHPELSPLKSTI